MQKGIKGKVVLSGLMGLMLMGPFCSSLVFAGAKKIVAVSNFENKTSYSGQWRLDNGMADQLTDALIQSGEFVVLERQTLSDVMDEQDLAQSGRMMKSKSAKTGKLTSSQILIKGTVTEFQAKSEGSSSGINMFGLKLGSKSGDAHVGMIIRLIDTTTGQVLDSKRVEGKAESGGFEFGLDLGGIDFGTDSFQNTPMGKATQMAIDEAVEYISEKLRGVPFKGRIIQVKNEDIYLSAGTRNGSSVGDMFTVYSVGEELVDPDTGEILGSEEEQIGSVEIFEVKEKYSKAKVVSGNRIQEGDAIREN